MKRYEFCYVKDLTHLLNNKSNFFKGIIIEDKYDDVGYSLINNIDEFRKRLSINYLRISYSKRINNNVDITSIIKNILKENVGSVKYLLDWEKVVDIKLSSEIDLNRWKRIFEMNGIEDVEYVSNVYDLEFLLRKNIEKIKESSLKKMTDKELYDTLKYILDMGSFYKIFPELKSDDLIIIDKDLKEVKIIKTTENVKLKNENAIVETSDILEIDEYENKDNKKEKGNSDNTDFIEK